MHAQQTGISRRAFLAGAGLALAGAAISSAGLPKGLGIDVLDLARPSEALAAGYSDVDPSAWYSTEGWIDEVTKSGLMSGYGGSTNFGPDDEVTRGQLATILFRAANPGNDATSNPAHYGTTTSFADVDPGLFYTAAVEWAYKNGVVTGYIGTNNFGPEDYVSREQIATMAYRYAKNVMGLDVTVGFNAASLQPDYAMVDDWARDGVVWCYYTGVMTGNSATSELMPLKYATRAQIAKIATVLTQYYPAHFAKQYFTGTMRIMTIDEVMATYHGGSSGISGSEKQILLTFDEEMNIYAMRADDSGFVVLRTNRILIGNSADLGTYASYDGKKVIMGLRNMVAFHDVTALLAPCTPENVDEIMLA